MSADGHEAQTTALRGGDEIIRVVRVAIDHRDAAVANKTIEQAELGLEVGLERRVIVEVIARDVGEGGGGDVNTVETELVEPVTRRFERQMIDALVLQSRELRVEIDGIGRRAPELHMTRRRIDPERADACRLATLRRPDLAQEMRDRRLAVGAGDGRHAFRLSAVERGGHARESEARIGIGNKDHAEPAGVLGQVRRTENRDGAAAHGVFDETDAVGFHAFERGEQESRLDLAAVRRKPAEFRPIIFHRRRRSHLPNTCL
jgi:hypothetical protein